MAGNAAIKIWLYEEDNPYESIYHYALVYNDCIEMYGITSEKAPGERYGSMTKVEGECFRKLKQELETESLPFDRIVARTFSGEAGLQHFCDFCKERGIELKYYIC